MKPDELLHLVSKMKRLGVSCFSVGDVSVTFDGIPLLPDDPTDLESEEDQADEDFYFSSDS